MKSPFLPVKTVVDIYHNPQPRYEFDFKGQQLEVFFGKGILQQRLQLIIQDNTIRLFTEDLPKIKERGDSIAASFRTAESAKFIIGLGGAVVLDKGKTIRNDKNETRLIAIPTSCSNDAFFTNKYKRQDKYHGSTSQALAGLMPDILIVDTEMIAQLVNEDIIYAGCICW